ncbi:hypothetical protein DSECCO2_618090 [anaerobic digester metagenome]
MLTKFKRNQYESFYDYLVKSCYVNSCSSNILIKPILVNNNDTNKFLPELLFQYRGKINVEGLNSIFEEPVLLQIKEDVRRLLGPFSIFLSHNLIFLFDHFFKYCPKCMEEGNHYLFHQFTFLDQCLIHNMPLVEHCPVCNHRRFSEFCFNKKSFYICPYCEIDLFRHFMIHSPMELVAKSYHNKSIQLNLPYISDKSCTIIEINPWRLKIKNKLPDFGAKFIKDYLINGEKSSSATISVRKVTKLTKYEISNLNNYYSNCDCDWINLVKDYSKNDLSILSSLENIINKVDYRIKNTFKVGYHCENMNRTNINYKTKLNNVFIKCLYGHKKIKKEQYAYYLWLYSCILRNRAGECNTSFLLFLYEYLIQLFYDFFNDPKSTVISADVFRLASKIIEFYLFEYFCRLLGFIENNIRNGDFIKIITEDLLDSGISVGPAYKGIIIENDLFYNVYFFEEEESQVNEDYRNNIDNMETMVGGYSLIVRYNVSIG